MNSARSLDTRSIYKNTIKQKIHISMNQEQTNKKPNKKGYYYKIQNHQRLKNKSNKKLEKILKTTKFTKGNES